LCPMKLGFDYLKQRSQPKMTRLAQKVVDSLWTINYLSSVVSSAVRRILETQKVWFKAKKLKSLELRQLINETRTRTQLQIFARI
jgi:hypothetical protein